MPKSNVKPRPAPVPKNPVPVAPPIGGSIMDTATLGDIATKGMKSNVFYLAASQSLVNSLKYQGDDGRSHWHSFHFKNMVGTIMLETALREPSGSYAEHHASCLSFPIRIFNLMRKQDQLVLLENLWGDCYKKVSPSQLAAEMMDGELGVAGDKSLPSSIRRRDGTGFFAILEAGPRPRAWKDFQIGFRIDGGKARAGSRDDLGRVSKEGMVALQKKPDLAVQVVKKFYHEHPSCQTSDLFIGYQNRDLYNESGTCVARSLLGATAFPYRYTENNADGGPADGGGELAFQYLFAVDCSGAKGVDTEKTQVEMGNNSLWRPGEKAFAGLGAERLLGWTRIVRKGQPPSGTPQPTGWSFMFLDSKWTWLKAPGGERQAFLEGELATWEPNRTYNISYAYDFQTN